MVRAFAGGLVLGFALLAAPASAQVPEPKNLAQPDATEDASRRPAQPAAELPARSDESQPQLQPKAAPESTLDAVREESAFVKETLRYVRLMEFTERLQAERERREFEQAAARYTKLQAFTRKLEAQHEQEVERDFNERVSLYVLKQAFTKGLLERRQQVSPESGAAPVPAPEKPVEQNPY